MRATPPRPGSIHRNADFTSPLTVPGGEVAGTQIVRELPPEVALTVWQVLRSVLLWAAEIPGQRGDLFEPRAMEQWERELLEGTFDPDLRCPLAVIVGELAAPEAASPEHLAHACLCVTEWGLGRNATRTALAFTEAAALCRPDHPRYAWMAGRLLRTHGYLREAEQWIKRSVRVAASRSDWEAQTLGLNSLGNVFYDAGKYREAQQSQLQALRSVRKHGLRHRKGEVLHDLFVATAYMGDLDQAEEYARAALDQYLPRHDRLAALAYDVAFLWMKRGEFARALPVLVELSEHFQEPHERVVVLASTARAAAACGEEAVYARFSAEAARLAAESSTGRGVPHALYELGLGASSLGRWDTAEKFLLRAESAARVRGEADVIVNAENALSAVRAQHSAERAELAASRAGKQHSGETLSNRFVVSLRRVPLQAEVG
ncbi:MAG: tetratricopeptide repeat protein [Gemmatimonadetes bacterium]|nr:tetratricopeptide repeat protein [Gemmatimonadota bacterium]